MELKEAQEIIEKDKAEREKRVLEKLQLFISELEKQENVKITLQPITFQPHLTITPL